MRTPIAITKTAVFAMHILRTRGANLAFMSSAAIAIALLQVLGCASIPQAQLDQFEIVDCELPGNVLRIGTGFASTGRARALRTGANDCAIRGGYFNLADQAKYQSALRVWLAPAEAGDAQAQLYVGQIYEKGLGQAPDASAAARWYQRAADQNFAPAQTALAVLYENGALTGTPAPEKALALYRKAARLSEGLRFDSEVQTRDTQIAELKRALELQREKSRRLRDQLRAKNVELDTQVRTLTGQLVRATQQNDQVQAAQASAALAKAQAQLSTSATQLADSNAELVQSTQAVALLDTTKQQDPQHLEGPKIQLIEPVSATMRGLLTVPVANGQSSVRVAAKISSAVKIKSVTINRARMRVDANGMVNADVSIKASTTMVEIIAIDENDRSNALPFVIANSDFMPPPQSFAAGSAAPAAGFGNYHALVIGNDQYREWEQLQTPRADAEAVAETLRTRYGFSVTLLLNATRSDIFRAIAKLRATLKENDNLLVYYSGHGSWDSANQQGYWIPIDGGKHDASNYISSSDITDQLSVIAARQVLVVADACYSGVLVRSVSEQIQAVNAAATPQMRQNTLSALAQLRSRKVISSGNIRQVMDGGAGAHSIFAKQFLDGLNRHSAPFQARELYDELAPRVSQAAVGFGEQQEPQYGQLRFAGHVGGDFVFVPKS
jgi:hypothetical protein